MALPPDPRRSTTSPGGADPSSSGSPIATSSSASFARQHATSFQNGGSYRVSSPNGNPTRHGGVSGVDRILRDDEADTEIEMGPIVPTGHRRRTSSLMNGGPNGGRPGAQSLRVATALGDGAKESAAVDKALSSSPGHHQSPDGGVYDEDLHDDEETGLTSRDRRRKRQKRRRNTLLDQRIVREKITLAEKKEADQNVVKKLLINGSLILLWYLFSLCISLYNKWMFDETKLNFPFPLFTTAVHMLVQFSLATLVLYFIPSLRPAAAVRRSEAGQSRQESGSKRPLMTTMFYLTRIGPCGAATGLDIGLGNTSLKFITLTFYTMCKSSSLAFVLLFAFVFRLEQPTWKLVVIIATMTAGVVMMVAGEVEFKLIGFFLVISAAFFSGFRWGLTQILLLRNPATSNPFSSIFFLAPVMFVTLLSIAIPVEGFSSLWKGLGALAETHGALTAPLIILFPGIIAFLMTTSEFALLQRTSVVTLSIAGIFKEAVTISAAALVFGDRLTTVNILGLFVTLGAIASYNWIKISKMREQAQEDIHRVRAGASESGLASLSNSGSDADNDEDGGGEEAGLLQQQQQGGDERLSSEMEMPEMQRERSPQAHSLQDS